MPNHRSAFRLTISAENEKEASEQFWFYYDAAQEDPEWGQTDYRTITEITYAKRRYGWRPAFNKPKMNAQQIRTTRQLRRAVEKGCHEFRLCLQGGLSSRKTITFGTRGRFHIVNHIDGSEQTLNQRQLYSHSSIGRAMMAGAFVAAPEGRNLVCRDRVTARPRGGRH